MLREAAERQFAESRRQPESATTSLPPSVSRRHACGVHPQRLAQYGNVDLERISRKSQRDGSLGCTARSHCTVEFGMAPSHKWKPIFSCCSAGDSRPASLRANASAVRNAPRRASSTVAPALPWISRMRVMRHPRGSATAYAQARSAAPTRMRCLLFRRLLARSRE